jgi:hypothetical protein
MPIHFANILTKFCVLWGFLSCLTIGRIQGSIPCPQHQARGFDVMEQFGPNRDLRSIAFQLRP